MTLKSLFWGLLKFLETTRVLDFKTILKIYYKSSLVYFDTKMMAEVGSQLEKPINSPKNKQKKGSREAEGLVGLFFLLKTMDVALKGLNGVTEALFLQGHP